MTLPYTLAFASGADDVTGAALARGDALTVEAVARVDAVGVCNRPLVQQYAADDAAFALYVTTDGRLYFTVYDDHGGASSAWSAPGAVTVQYQHLAGTFDRAALSVRVFVDGQDATAGYVVTGYGISTSAAPAKLGGFLGDLAQGFVGRVAWARVSSAVRYAAGFVAPYGQAPATDDNTALLWSLSEGAGATTGGDTITGATWGLWGGADVATRNAVLNHVLGGPNYTRPATLYLGLLTANPAAAGDEVTASGYARVAVTNDATTVPAASVGVKTGQFAAAFGQAGADWGRVKAWGLWDATSAGDLVAWGPVAQLTPVWAGARVRLAAGALEIGSV